MGKHVIETIMGAVVLLVAIGFLIFAYRSSDITSTEGYRLYAKFDRADGLNIGSDVRISGIKVGRVSGQKLDPKNYLAEIFLTIDESVQIPIDSTAEIISDGFLGSKYLSIVPGGDEKTLAKNGRIKYTQSAISLESLIGKFMYGGTGGDSEEKPQASQNTTSQKPVQNTPSNTEKQQEVKPVQEAPSNTEQPQEGKPVQDKPASEQPAHTNVLD